jgi:hypothetical protein
MLERSVQLKNSSLSVGYRFAIFHLHEKGQFEVVSYYEWDENLH